MGNFMVLLKKNLIEMVRNKRIIIFSVVFVAISIISAFSAKILPELFEMLLGGLEEDGNLYFVEATVADSYIQYISNFGEIALLLVIIMFASCIVKEKKRGTYDVLKMNNVTDNEIVLSHLVSQVVLISVSYILSVATFVLLNIVLFNQIMGVRGFVVLLYIYLLLLVGVSFSMFCSCLCKSNKKVYLLAIIGYFVISFLEIIPVINKVNPFHLLSISSNLMYYKNYSLKENVITLISSLLIVLVLVIISLFIVKNRINNRKDLTNEDNTGRI